MEPPSRSKARGGMSRRDRDRLLVAKQASKRQQEEQVRRWIDQFDANCSGRLERNELAALLEHLHPEAGRPKEEALDILISNATEVRTYTMHLQGNRNAAIAPDKLIAVVSGYAMYLLASSAFDKRQVEGVVSLSDLPSIMKELGKADGSDIEGSDVDFVMDCAASSLHGLDSASNISREDLMPAMAAWKVNELEQAGALEEEEAPAPAEATTAAGDALSGGGGGSGGMDDGAARAAAAAAHDDDATGLASRLEQQHMGAGPSDGDGIDAAPQAAAGDAQRGGAPSRRRTAACTIS